MRNSSCSPLCCQLRRCLLHQLLAGGLSDAASVTPGKSMQEPGLTPWNVLMPDPEERFA